MSVNKARIELLDYVSGIVAATLTLQNEQRILELAEAYAKEKRKARDNRDRWKQKKRGYHHGD